MVFFWNWFVRNPFFALAAVAFLAVLVQVVEWPLGLTVGTFGLVVGDCGRHLARKATVRRARREAELAAELSSAAARARFTDYNRVDRETAA